MKKQQKTAKDYTQLEQDVVECTKRIITHQTTQFRADAIVRALNELIEYGDPKGIGAYNLGLLTYHGYGTPRDLKKSFDYHSAAAKKNNLDAMFELYVLLSAGQGVEKNEQQALEWCKKAAEQGQLRACYNMGTFYASGNGVEKNIATAIQWYEKASAGGHGRASATLGVMYFLGGDGVTPDTKKAASYLAKADQQGFNAKQFLDSLGLQLPS